MIYLYKPKFHCVEVRETQSNMAFREGHRSDNEDLFAGFE